MRDRDVFGSKVVPPTIFVSGKKMKPSMSSEALAKEESFVSCRDSGASCTDLSAEALAKEEGSLHTPRGVLHIRLTTWPAIALAKAAEALLRNMKQLRFAPL